MTKTKTNSLRKGSLSDEEKRSIEQLIKFDTFAEIGKKLKRDPTTIRKFCQRNGITKDKASVSKHIEEKKKRSPHFEELANVLTEREMDLAVRIYTELMKQFGSDILPSEEIQVIDFCVISALLNRALAREKQILQLTEQQSALRADLEKTRASIDDDEDREVYYEKVDEIDVRIAALSDELAKEKANQRAFIDKKEKAQRNMNASRDQRANELIRKNENWADFVAYLKNNHNFRIKLGYELEKFRLSIKEEYIRLSQLHEYADGVADFPVLNSEIAKKYLEEDT